MKTMLWTRKDFLRATVLSGGLAAITRGQAAPAIGGKGSANGDIRMGVIGCGPIVDNKSSRRGAAHVRWFGAVGGVRVVAVCDVDSEHLDGGAKILEDQGKKVTRYRDVRKLLEDPDIDAVSIATPHHWHALMTVWACQAGKDVFVEKPVSHCVWEGRKAVEAARRYNRIVQTGTQSRSDPALQEAFAYINQGHLGKIKLARGFCYKLRPSIGRTSGPQPIRRNVDYDLWCGPAPLSPLRRAKLHYDWHWFWDTGNADLGNQGIHEVDLCRWALGYPGFPSAVMSIGGRFGENDDAETPDTQIVVLGYEPAPIVFEVRGLPQKSGLRSMDHYRGIRLGITIECEHGTFVGGANGGFIYDNEGKRTKQFSSNGGGSHAANFIKAVRSRRVSDLRADIEDGHVSSALCHLGNISYRLGQDTASHAVREAVRAHAPTQDAVERMLQHLEANDVSTRTTPSVVGPSLKVAAGQEKFVSTEQFDAGYWANTMLRREYRPPYVVPENV